MPKVKVRSADIHYHVHGEGEPLLLITGFSGDLYNWKKAIPLLEKRYQVIAFDNRGSGLTEDDGTPFTMDDLADDAAGLLDTLGIEKSHVVGWSMGGNVAQLVAMRHPRRVGGLVLMSTYTKEPDRSRFAIDAMVHSVREGASMETFLQMMNAWCSTEGYYRGKESMCLNSNGCDPRILDGYARQKKALDAFTSKERLRDIRAPTLVIHGIEDIMVPLYFGEEVAASIPGAKFVTIPAAGHFLPPSGYAPAILRFLANHPLKD